MAPLHEQASAASSNDGFQLDMGNFDFRAFVAFQYFYTQPEYHTTLRRDGALSPEHSFSEGGSSMPLFFLADCSFKFR